MKLTIFLICISVLGSLAVDSYSQSTRLTVEMKNAAIKDILTKIETQSEFRFFYSGNVDVEQKASVSQKDKKVFDILDELFDGTGIRYEVYGKQIALLAGGENSTFTVQQQKSVSGKVTNTSGEPLPGVTVLVKGTTTGTITDANGIYSLTNVQPDAIVVFSFVGMKSQEIAIGSKTTINVVLTEETVGIEEVVAIGYGTQKKVNLTGSVVTISSEEIGNRPVNNIAQALQGQLAGVLIRQSNGGQPGAENLSIQIRGKNSFATGTDPLVIIDGIAGSINDIDINSVENISVLKDAASAAIYGSRASNGVILITTKNGEAKKLTVEYSGKVLSQSKYMWPERIWNVPEYMRLHNYSLDINKSTWGRYSQEAIDGYKTGPSEEYPWVNWEKEYIKNITAHSHNLSFSGSTGKTSYHVSGNLWMQDGLIRCFNNEKYNVLTNLESQLNKKVKFGMSISSKIENTLAPYLGGPGYISMLLSNRPTYTAHLRRYPERWTFTRYIGAEWASANPEAVTTLGGSSLKTRSVRSNAFLEVNLIEGLTWITKGAMNFEHVDSFTQVPEVRIWPWDYPNPNPAYGNWAMNGQSITRINNTLSRTENYTLYSTLNYVKNIGKHGLNVLAGASQESGFGKFVRADRQGFPNLDIVQIDAGSNVNWSNSGNVTANWSIRSFFGRIMYNFDNKYLLELNGRSDGSSRFPKTNRYAFFPSISAAWRVSEEEFIKDNHDWLNNLKLRASIGTMGNDAIGDYPYQSTISLQNNYPLNGSVISGAARTNLANEKIKWETTRNYDVGFDANIKNGLLGITFDWFDKRTEGILRGSQLPGYVGLGAPVVNEGIVSNKGFEIILDHNGKLNDEVRYGINVMFSKYKNKLVKFGAPQLDFNLMKEGEEMYRYFTYKADGLFQSQAEIDAAPNQLVPKKDIIPGDIRLKDVSGPNGVPDGKVTPDDRIGFDGFHPSFDYGSSFYVSWKGFDLSAVIQGVEGIKRNVNQDAFKPWGNGSAPLTYWRNAWTSTNTDTNIPIMRGDWFGVYNQTMNVASSWWLKDASYFRLKNIALSYTIPKHVTQKFGVDSFKLQISAENVFTITPFEFGDPESREGYSYPSLRTFSFGIDITL